MEMGVQYIEEPFLAFYLPVNFTRFSLSHPAILTTMRSLSLLTAVGVASLSAGSIMIERRAPVLDDVLNAHNDFRAQHGAAPLTWSDTLANAAQSWADRCVFEHSGGAVGPYGGTYTHCSGVILVDGFLSQ